MPLLDHFTDPVARPRRWASFHTYWVTAVGGLLNRTLPPRFCATVETYLGAEVAADVADFDLGPPAGVNGAGGGVAVAAYTAPPATGSLPAVFPDSASLPVIDTDLDRLVAVVELVSPSNKHDPASRRAFAAKCAGYIHKGVGLVVVDVAFRQRFSPHDDLTTLLGLPSGMGPVASSAAAYRPVTRDDVPAVDYWLRPLAVGQPLPEMPLALKGWGLVPLDLEDAYVNACRVGRVT